MGISNHQTAYSFANVVATVNGRNLVGFWDGDDAIQVEEGADIGTGLVGADGSSIFSQHVNNSASITLRIMQGSPAHKLLINQMAAQKQGNMAGVSFAFSDKDSGEGGACDKAFIQNGSNVQFGTNASVRTWVLWTGYMVRNRAVS